MDTTLALIGRWPYYGFADRYAWRILLAVICLGPVIRNSGPFLDLAFAVLEGGGVIGCQQERVSTGGRDALGEWKCERCSSKGVRYGV